MGAYLDMNLNEKIQTTEVLMDYHLSSDIVLLFIESSLGALIVTRFDKINISVVCPFTVQ